jgi:hypothetical protein
LLPCCSVVLPLAGLVVVRAPIDLKMTLKNLPN